MSRFLVLSAFLTFSVFAVIIGWSYERGQSDASPNQQAITPTGARSASDRPVVAVPATSTMASGAVPPTESADAVLPEPTRTPSPTSTPIARATSTAAPAPSPTPGLQDRASRAEADLRSGQLEAVIHVADSATSTVMVTFDRGAESQAPRMQFRYSYQYTYPLGQSEGAHVFELERVFWGSTLWQRRRDQPWIEQPGNEDSSAMAERLLQRFLPRTDVAHDIQYSPETPGILTWYDPKRNADVTLDVDLDTGFPVRMTETDRASDRVLVVTYSGWNEPVELTPPA